MPLPAGVPDFETRHIDSLIGMYFGKSVPGACLHYLVIGVWAGARSPLGLPRLTVTVGAIDDTPNGDDWRPGVFIGKSIIGMTVEAMQTGPVVMAVLTREILAAKLPAGAPASARAELDRLADAGRLQDSPFAEEVTVLYAAHADGRRWHGTHRLTGPSAGQVDGPTGLRVGERHSSDQDPFHQMLRKAVGLRW